MLTSSAFGIVTLLMLSGGFSLPLGLPPLPEDPVISRVAPEECLAYVSWAGTAAPDAKSANQTEQLLAEPEVQQLFAGIDNAITAGINQNAQHGPRDAESVKDIYPLAKTLLTRPAAVFVSLSKVEAGPPGPPNFQGGAVFNLADKTAAVGETLDRLEKLLPPGSVEKVEVAGAPFRRLKLGPMPPVTWGLRGKYLLVGVGEGAMEGILQRAKGQPPAWLAAIRKQLPVDRPSTLIYVNIKQTVGQFAPLGGPKVKQGLDSIGLGNVSYLAAVTGFDGKGTVARTLLAIDGQPQGVFALAAAKPLAAADLAPIPRDATIAAAARLDANATRELLLAMINNGDPDAGKGVARSMSQMEKDLGIDLQEDLLKPLGDVWCAYNSPAEGGLLATGLTGVVQVKDHDRLKATLDKLVALFRERVERPAAEQAKKAPSYYHRRAPRIVETACAGQAIYHFDAPDGDFPFAPAWCLTEKELIVSVFPQNIRSYLARGKDVQSLAAVPEVAQALDEGGAVAVSYCDTRKVAEFVYPLLCIGGRLLSANLGREGISLDCSLVPSAAAIFPHLQPSLVVVRRTAAGIEVQSRGSLAGVGALLPASALLLGTGRQMSSAPKAAYAPASSMSSMSKLRMIALAALNYEAGQGSLPPTYISDKATGKPLLSWRVALLPYLEQNARYHAFHLDEPWDSPNNKALIADVPDVYRSPGGPMPGKTRYVTLRYPDGAFPGKEGIRLAQITHGTSKTILAVEADEAHAVIWTKPDDLDFDPQKPATGLTGQPGRSFIAAFCDGSVRFIYDSMGPEFLRDAANRNGGKAGSER